MFYRCAQRVSLSFLWETEIVSVWRAWKWMFTLWWQFSQSVVSDSVTPSLLCPWDFPSKNTGGSCHVLLQGFFLTQGSNLGPLHCRWILY